MKSQTELNRKYRKTKLALGWKQINWYVPVDLKEQLAKVMRDYKYQHPTLYR